MTARLVFQVERQVIQMETALAAPIGHAFLAIPCPLARVALAMLAYQ